MLINLKTKISKNFLNLIPNAQNKKDINLASFNLKASFHQKTLKTKTLTGGLNVFEMYKAGNRSRIHKLLQINQEKTQSI